MGHANEPVQLDSEFLDTGRLSIPKSAVQRYRLGTLLSGTGAESRVSFSRMLVARYKIALE